MAKMQILRFLVWKAPFHLLLTFNNWLSKIVNLISYCFDTDYAAPISRDTQCVKQERLTYAGDPMVESGLASPRTDAPNVLDAVLRVTTSSSTSASHILRTPPGRCIIFLRTHALISSTVRATTTDIQQPTVSSVSQEHTVLRFKRRESQIGLEDLQIRRRNYPLMVFN